jgi:hypothetical protein
MTPSHDYDIQNLKQLQIIFFSSTRYLKLLDPSPKVVVDTAAPNPEGGASH